MAFMASMVKGQDRDMAAVTTSIFANKEADTRTLLVLMLESEDHAPEKDFAISVSYRGEIIDVLMSDVMNELRPLNRHKP